MKRQLFLDQDNFLVDFSGGFKRRFGVTDEEVTKEEMWELIFSVDDFFLQLDYMEGAEDFFWSVQHKKPIILTSTPIVNHSHSAPPNSPMHVKHVVDQKREWIRRRSPSTLLIPAPGVAKSNFMFNPGDILVDDYGVNCREWEAAGGVAIKHERFSLTSQRLFEEFMR